MTGSSADIASHYGGRGLYDRIVAGFAAAGKPAETLTPDDLKPVDEFHIGGLEATRALLAQLSVSSETRALDIGCGIGGTARLLAGEYGARTTGLDMTPDFVATARRLTGLVGLDAEFVEGGALAMPLEDGSFDLATLLHVGMNIADKPKLFQEAARALRPGGVFAVYDIMRVAEGGPNYPVPWASAPAQSCLEAPDAYRAAGAAAGFVLRSERDRGDFARDFFKRLAAATAKNGPPPVGLPLIMGAEAPTKIKHMVQAVSAGQLAPVEMIFDKPA